MIEKMRALAKRVNGGLDDNAIYFDNKHNYPVDGILENNPCLKGYDCIYRDGTRFSNRVVDGEGILLGIDDDVLRSRWTFTSGYADVFTAQLENRIMVFGGRVFPKRLSGAVSRIFDNFEEFLKLDEIDMPADQEMLFGQTRDTFVEGYYAVMLHGATERFVDIRKRFDRATDALKPVIFNEAYQFVEKFESTLPMIEKKAFELLGRDIDKEREDEARQIAELCSSSPELEQLLNELDLDEEEH